MAWGEDLYCICLLYHRFQSIVYIFSLLLVLQVKIWFQNKRSKYKKIMKNGPCGPEGDHLAPPPPSSSSPCSLWDISMAAKGAPVHSGGYMNNFAHWYPGHQQDSMPRTQMMWQTWGCKTSRTNKGFIPCKLSGAVRDIDIVKSLSCSGGEKITGRDQLQ